MTLYLTGSAGGADRHARLMLLNCSDWVHFIISPYLLCFHGGSVNPFYLSVKKVIHCLYLTVLACKSRDFTVFFYFILKINWMLSGDFLSGSDEINGHIQQVVGLA